MIQYQLTQGSDGRKTLTVFVPGDGVLVFQSDHPRFSQATNLVTLDTNGDTYYEASIIADLVKAADIPAVVADRLLTADVSIEGGRVSLSNGEDVPGVLNRKILDAVKEDDGLTWRSLARFLGRLAKNPSSYSREQLYEFIDKHGFTINQDGSFIAFKGVREGDEGLESLNRGVGIVNGVRQDGAISNNVGDKVEFPREKVDTDPHAACSTGLHVGSYDYASHYGSVLLEVHVGPEDVVSVPYDSDAAKVRVCGYRVVSRAEPLDAYLFEVYDREDD